MIKYGSYNALTKKDTEFDDKMLSIIIGSAVTTVAVFLSIYVLFGGGK